MGCQQSKMVKTPAEQPVPSAGPGVVIKPATALKVEGAADAAPMEQFLSAITAVHNSSGAFDAADDEEAQQSLVAAATTMEATCLSAPQQQDDSVASPLIEVPNNTVTDFVADASEEPAAAAVEAVAESDVNKAVRRAKRQAKKAARKDAEAAKENAAVPDAVVAAIVAAAPVHSALKQQPTAVSNTAAAASPKAAVMKPEASGDKPRVAFDKAVMRATAPKPAPVATAKMSKKQRELVQAGHVSTGRRGPVASKWDKGGKGNMQRDVYLQMANAFERLLTNAATINAHLDTR